MGKDRVLLAEPLRSTQALLILWKFLPEGRRVEWLRDLRAPFGRVEP